MKLFKFKLQGILPLIFSGHYQGAGMEVEQPGHKLVSIWDVGVRVGIAGPVFFLSFIDGMEMCTQLLLFSSCSLLLIMCSLNA